MRPREQRVIERQADRNASAFFAPERGRHQIELIDRDDLELGKTDAPQLRDKRGGVTDEHDVGLYFKRMHILNTLFGDEQHHVARYGSLPSFEAGIERRSA